MRSLTRLPSARLLLCILLSAAVLAPLWWWLRGAGVQHGPQLVAAAVVVVGVAGIVATRRGRPGEYEPLALFGAVLFLASVALSRARVEGGAADSFNDSGQWAVYRFALPAPEQWASIRLAIGTFAASFLVSLAALWRIVRSGWRRRGVYLCLYGCLSAPAFLWIVLWGIGGPNVGDANHLESAGAILTEGPYVFVFALASGALAYLVASFLVRTAGLRFAWLRRVAWPGALVGWGVLLAVNLPKVIGADFGRSSGVSRLPVSTTALYLPERIEIAVTLHVPEPDHLFWTTQFTNLGEVLNVGWAEGMWEGSDPDESWDMSRAASHGRLLESVREDPRWWGENVLALGVGVTAGPDAPFSWLADELRWLREHLDVERAWLTVARPESRGGWRVWLAGYPTRWSLPGHLPVLLEMPADGTAPRLRPGPDETFAELCARIDVLRAAGAEEVLLELD